MVVMTNQCDSNALIIKSHQTNKRHSGTARQKCHQTNDWISLPKSERYHIFCRPSDAAVAPLAGTMAIYVQLIYWGCHLVAHSEGAGQNHGVTLDPNMSNTLPKGRKKDRKKTSKTWQKPMKTSQDTVKSPRNVEETLSVTSDCGKEYLAPFSSFLALYMWFSWGYDEVLTAFSLSFLVLFPSILRCFKQVVDGF